MQHPEEFEVIAYPRLNHVMIGNTYLTYRNPHLHSELEISLVLSGSATVHLRHRSFEVTQDSMMVFNSHEMHEIVSHNRDGVRIMYLQISNKFCRDYMRQLCDFEFLNNNITDCVTPKQNAQLFRLILHLLENYTQTGQISTLNCLADLCQLLSSLFSWIPCRLLDASDQSRRDRRSNRMRQITGYIDAHYTEKITLQALAEKTGVTVTYLSHFIRENLGMTFQEYLNTVRLEKSLQLLETTDMNLMDISLASGFSDIKYMTKSFVQRFGCPPREYRKGMERVSDSQRKQQTADNAQEVKETGQEWIVEFLRQRMGSGQNPGQK